MSRPLMVYRVHRTNPGMVRRLLAFAEQAGCDAVLACDERLGPVQTFGAAKVSVTDLLADGLLNTEHGLEYDPYWLCGDYALYTAFRRHPGYRHYWLTEPDVLFHFQDVRATFRQLESLEQDLLAIRIRAAERAWPWYDRAAGLLRAEVFRCFFPVARFSAEAAGHLLDRRVALSAHVGRLAREGAAVPLWPNDEGFVATETVAAGLSWADFDAVLPGCCPPETCDFWRFFLRADVLAWGQPGRIYHSVLEGTDFIQRVLLDAPAQYSRDELLGLVDRYTGVEWDEAGARRCRRAIESATSASCGP